MFLKPFLTPPIQHKLAGKSHELRYISYWTGPGSGLQQAMSDGLQGVMISCFTLMLFSQAERVAKRSAEEESEERFLDQTFNSGGG